MFDSSFPEIVLILLVALIVIGPERLPRLARTMGHWVGRGRSMFNTMRNEVEREIQLDELRKAESDLKKDLDFGKDLDFAKDLKADVEQSGGTEAGGKDKNRSAQGAKPATAAPAGAGQTGTTRSGTTKSENKSATGKADASKGGSSENHGSKAGP